MNFTIHNAAGRILRTGFCPDGMEVLQAKDGESMVPDTADLDKHHVVDGAITERPGNPATLTGNTLSDLPCPCVVRVNGREYDCDEATADLLFTHVGTYKITVSAFPYLDATFTITK